MRTLIWEQQCRKVQFVAWAKMATKLCPPCEKHARSFSAARLHILPRGKREDLRCLEKSDQCMPAKTVQYLAVSGGLAAILGFLAILAAPSEARVTTERLGQNDQAASTSSKIAADTPIKQQVNEVMRLSSRAREAAQNGDFERALEDYTSIVQQFPALAISNYARIGRAMLLYQAGNTSEAILELEDLESSLRGFAEVHAALASIIYAERPSEILYAEEQFDLASEFDSRYSDVNWVEKEKHWPPAMLQALGKFANLK